MDRISAGGEDIPKTSLVLPDNELEGEPDVADELDEEEGLVGVGLGLVQRPVCQVAPEVGHSYVSGEITI